MMMIFAVMGKGGKKLAHRFEKGTHLYFPFKNGLTVQDSQRKPRYYLTKESLQNNLNESDYSEVVEYAPVVHARWIETGYYSSSKNPIYICSACHKEVEDRYIKNHESCLHCGAKMDLEN